MKLSKFVLGLALLSALCFAGCSDGSSGGSNSDGNRGTLDLRIQNNGTIAGSSRFIEDEAGSSTAYEASTELVSAVAMKDGIHFTIKNPASISGTDEKYKNGCNYIAVYRIEKINGEDFQTTNAVINHKPFDNPDVKEINFTYPLCEAGEVYKFKVQIEPARGQDENRQELPVDREHSYWHYLTVKAKGGIGDIDYSNLKNGEWAFASYNGETANVWIENVIAPQDTVVQNVSTYIDIFYGDKDWDTPGKTDWYCNYENSSKAEKNVYIELKRWDGKPISELSSTFFAQYSFTFEVPSCYPEVKQWRTATLDTDLIEVD